MLIVSIFRNIIRQRAGIVMRPFHNTGPSWSRESASVEHNRHRSAEFNKKKVHGYPQLISSETVDDAQSGSNYFWQALLSRHSSVAQPCVGLCG